MEKVELLRQIALFAGLDEADLHKIGEVVTELTFPAGGRIFAEGDSGDSLFVIKYGTVQVLKRGREGEDEEVARLGKGDHFGEMALIDNERRSATAQAIEHTELIQLKRGDLENFLARDHALAHRLYRAFARYLSRRLRRTTTDLTFIKEVARRRHG